MIGRGQMPFQISKPPERSTDMSLYENIRNRRESGKPMRKKGAKGAPSDQDFVNAAKTAKKPKGMMNGGMVKKGYKNGGCVMAGRGGSFKGNS
jgi:hypothetical protein